jgi:hypothetical protein
MKEMIVLGFYLLLFLMFWLLPLYFICQWAKRRRKDYRVVGLVGILTSFPIALIVALCLPKLSDEELAAIQRKGERQPLGETAVVLAGLGVCSLGLLAFMAWLTLGLK